METIVFVIFISVEKLQVSQLAIEMNAQMGMTSDRCFVLSVGE